ncbi:multiple sugar transport system substrate-binding protein [Streptomyces nodosus]|nr:multiple sugar transport system substrate-binding protein [Streptomyces nodosus]
MAMVLLAATACSSSHDGNAVADGPTAGPAKGTITWFANQFGPTDVDVRKTLITAFEKANPGIKVELEQAPSNSDTFRAALTGQIFGGSSGFDVYNGDVTWPAQFGKAGLALALNKYFPASYWKTFSPGLVDSVTYNNMIMGAPLFTDHAFLFYRKDLLEKEHLPVPTTWEQMQRAAQKLQQDRLVKYGFAGQWASYEGLTAGWTEFAADAGARSVNQAGTKATVDSAASLKALTFMRGLITKGIAPQAITTFKEPQSETLFTSGQVAFERNWTYAYADANSPASSIAGKVGIAPLPTFAGQPGPGYSVTGGWNMYLNPHSRNIGASVAFIKWMTGAQAQKTLATAGGEIPTNASVLADPTVQASNPAYPIAAKNKLRARPSHVVAYPQVSQAIYRNINAALTGGASLSRALSKASSAITSALGNSGL